MSTRNVRTAVARVDQNPAFSSGFRGVFTRRLHWTRPARNHANRPRNKAKRTAWWRTAGRARAGISRCCARWARSQPAYVAYVAVAVLAFAASAHANPLVRWHRSWMPPAYASTWHPAKHHHHHAKRRPRVVAKPTPPTNPPAPAPGYKPTGLRYVAYDNERCTAQDTVPGLQAHGANVLRYIVSFNGSETYAGVPCIQAARASGYKTYLSIAFPPNATPQADAGYFADVLKAYGPVWAVAVGNEDPVTPEFYRQVWDATTPIISRIDPGALHVAGDTVPWGMDWAEQVIAEQLPGIDAFAYHCYVMNSNQAGIVNVPELAADAAAHGLPLWGSEMAPATAATTPGFLLRQTLGAYNAEVAQTVSASPNLAMDSYYTWPSIGAS